MYLVATFLFISGNEVLKRWKNLRDSFAKAEKKMKDGKASGSQATKKRKYIFSNELQFLKKIYTGREVTESHSPEVEEEGATEEESTEKRPNTPEVTINEKSKTRKHKKMDEVDLKIIKALESTKETPDSNMSFFQSLMPHIANFNNSEILQFKMGVLQVISNIKNQQTLVPPNQGFPTPFFQQSMPYNPHSFHTNFPTQPQQPVFNPQSHTSFHPQQHSVLSNPSADQTKFTAYQAQAPNIPTTPLTQQTKKILTLPTADECDKAETARQYIENWIPQMDLDNDGSSSFCSNASTPQTLDFANL